MMSEHIATLYFKYETLNGHREGCENAPDTWEVTRRIEYRPFPKDDEDEIRETSIRLVCQQCGAVEFFRVPGHLERQFATSAELGYGSAPTRLCGLWLWAGPELLPGHGLGPDAYYVTTDRIRPYKPSQVAGVIGQGRRSARANAAVRWFASLGCTDYGSGKVSAAELGADPDGFRTPTAAVKWMAGQLASRRDLEGELGAIGGAS